eukprot:TRINITY_DN3542_c0_g1_i2.p1 TRINITY_DN3542_c0_g1~~TRINITY_DN3542_c0_g1_i2.p1  ORF type:complete len:509 (+),score=104.70 TRINITY_DN3542_c0_g1_i2:181-1707(+)
MNSPRGERGPGAQPMLLRYASFSGSAAERRPDSKSQPIRKLSKLAEDSVAQNEAHPNYDELDPREGRKFLLQQKFPEKHLSKQRRMSALVSPDQLKGRQSPTRNSVASSVHSFGAISDDGFNASYNQDALLSEQNMKGIQNTALFAVFDGHGVGGDQVAHFAKDNLYRIFLELYGNDGQPTPDAEIPVLLEKCFVDTQDLMEKTGNQFLLAGTTASAVLIQNRKIFIAHVGDSRVVIGRECMCCLPLMNAKQKDMSSSEITCAHITAISTTIDHRVGEIPEERERVEKAGGAVMMDPGLPPDALDEVRIYAQGQTYPGLVTTRTLGDVLAHGLGVISNPDVSSKVLDKHDKVLILASDGVWDILSSQEAINLVCQYDDPIEATNALIAECIKGWSDEYDAGDNVSAIVLFLNAFRAPKGNFPTCKRGWEWNDIRTGADLKASQTDPTPIPAEYAPPANSSSANGNPQGNTDGTKSSQPNSPKAVDGAMIVASGPSSPKRGRSNLCTIL